MVKNDYISRQAAIDAICEHGVDLERRGITVIAVVNHKQATVDLLENLPSAERRGRWIRTGEDGYCSVCKCDMPMFRNDWEWEYTETPYCPNCGAKMEMEE